MSNDNQLGLALLLALLAIIALIAYVSTRPKGPNQIM